MPEPEMPWCNIFGPWKVRAKTSDYVAVALKMHFIRYWQEPFRELSECTNPAL